jgi:transposase InsO family protein
MAYTTNHRMPRVRRDAIRMLRKGYSTREVARHFSFSQGAIVQWSKKANKIGDHPIPTQSSRPKTSPKRISDTVRDQVADKRKELGRSIEVVHYALKQDSVNISLSSVYRILRDRYLLKRKSPWKKFHRTCLRPEALKPGDLVQLDTMHFMVNGKERIYVYALIDVYSRIGYARAYHRISSGRSLKFLREARKFLPFHISCIQTDHGPEFGSHFSQRIGVVHRHSRIRKPNDNAHVERFNRTLQEECLNLVPLDVVKMNTALKKYLHHYNNTRHHFSLSFHAPFDTILDSLTDYKV